MSLTLQTSDTKSAHEIVRVLGPSVHSRVNLLDLWSHRDLISLMVNRDLIGKYKGSMLGMIWPVLNPLGHLLLYTFVFSIILKVKFGQDGSTTNFAIYLMTGLSAWLAFAESLTQSSSAILAVPNLVKRVVFPLEIIPVVAVITSAVTAIISFALIVIGTSLYAGRIHPTIAFIPLILLSQLIFTTGLCWFAASIGVFLQDLYHFMSLGLSVWMYATPIVFPPSLFPSNLKFLCYINPMAGLVGDYRRAIIEGLPPDWKAFSYYTTLGVIVFVTGYYFFAKTKKSFADVM